MENNNNSELLKENTKAVKMLYEKLSGKSKSKAYEILAAAILSLATVGSAWCAYQSSLWGGEQTFFLADANRSGREASENSVQAVQRKSNDGILIIQFIEAYRKGDKELSEFYYSKFNQNLKTATDEWIKTEPLKNIQSNSTPLTMKSYVSDLEKKSESLLIKAGEYMEKAQNANKTSDLYVLFTVLFASVLFIIGIGTTFESINLKKVSLTLAAVLITGIIIALTNMPVSRL
ncbi:MAG TPA: hypothetical protein PK536_01230 [Ignavibacteria bacterium]|nr:hypothetical protein [Ignavibacteria bacterium]HRJ99539.1 hypothetical protein [Ignavibacteria bacterium]